MIRSRRALLAGCSAACILAVAVGACGGAVADLSVDGAADGGDLRARRDARAPGSAITDDGSVSPSCGGGICPSPRDVSGFVPTWKPPTGAHQGQCTAAMIDEYYQDCLSTNSAQSCTAFGPSSDAAHQACRRCMESRFDDAAWGPVVRSPNLFETNEAGCIALLDPSAQDCAKAVQTAAECSHAACDAVCPLNGTATAFDDWVQCSSAANSCGCASWSAASDCIRRLVTAGGPAAGCLVGQTFQDLYAATAPIFCGT